MNRLPAPSDVVAAEGRIRGLIRRTPVLRADAADFGWVAYFKLEFLQHTGTFKARGMFNRLLACRERGELREDAGIVLASGGGNAGNAYTFVGSALGLPVTIVAPSSAHPRNLAELRRRGANVLQVSGDSEHAAEVAFAHSARTGAVYCHAYDQLDVVAGAGTVGSELLAQVTNVDRVILAVGGGGLMAGVATALDGQAQVVAVEPAGSPTLHAALAAGEPVEVSPSGVAKESLGARKIGQIAFDVAVAHNVRSVIVDDAEILEARRELWQKYRIVVEAGGAAAYAALRCNRIPMPADERIAVVLCGANTDPSDLFSTHVDE